MNHKILFFLISLYHHYFSECYVFEEDPLEVPVDFLIQCLHNPDWFFVQKTMEIITFLKIGDNFVDSFIHHLISDNFDVFDQVCQSSYSLYWNKKSYMILSRIFRIGSYLFTILLIYEI